jgi:hypothetical protein
MDISRPKPNTPFQWCPNPLVHTAITQARLSCREKNAWKNHRPDPFTIRKNIFFRLNIKHLLNISTGGKFVFPLCCASFSQARAQV